MSAFSFTITQAADSVKEQTLLDIDQSLVTAGRFLQEYASDKKKSECLKAFAECPKIVQWIQEETNGIILLTEE